MVLCDVLWCDTKDCGHGDFKNYTDVLEVLLMRVGTKQGDV